MFATLLAESLKTLVVLVTTAVTVTATVASTVPLAIPGATTEPAGTTSWGRVEVASFQEEDVDALIRQLGSGDAHERAMAACRLGRIRSTSQVEPARAALIGLLGDGTPVESRLCRENWNWNRGRQQESSPGREAAIALERVGSSAVEPVIRVLSDNNAVARENGAFALGLLEDERAIDPLVGVLNDSVAAVRERAAWSLGLIEDPAAIQGLSGALGDADADVREQAAWALGMIEHSSAVPALSDALRTEKDPEVREQIAWGLGMIEHSDAVAALIEALDDADADVREQAAWALGMIEHSSAVDALADALDGEEDADVKKQILWALMRCIDGDDPDLNYEELAEKLRKAFGLSGTV